MIIILYCCIAYSVITLVNFIWRRKNIIKYREGEWFIAQASYSYNLPAHRYDVLNRIKAKEELSEGEIEQWNDAIDYLSDHWIRIYAAITFKSIFFPFHFICYCTILFCRFIDAIIEKIKNIKVRPFEKMKRKYIVKPAEIQKEAKSYRDKPEQELQHYPSEAA